MNIEEHVVGLLKYGSLNKVHAYTHLETLYRRAEQIIIITIYSK